MKTLKNSFLGLCLLVCFSCGGSSESAEGGETTVSSNADCVFSYMDKYDELLPLDVIQKHYKGDMSAAKKQYTKNTDPKRQKQDSYLYTWASDRTKTMEILGQKIEVPLENEIGIKWLGDDLYKIMSRENAVASFKAFYHTPTQAELDAAFSKAEEKVSENKNVSQETKDTAMDMAKGLADGAKFEDVNGLGDAAAWDVRDNALILLIGEKTLKIVAGVSADSEANKKLAVELAKEVLAKCN